MPWPARLLAVATVGVLLLAVALAAAILLDAPAIGGIDDATLERSVSDEIGTSFSLPDLPSCRRQGGGRRCEVGDRDSGSANYDVRMRGRRCWTATLAEPSHGMPGTVSGCATLRHQLDLGL